MIVLIGAGTTVSVASAAIVSVGTGMAVGGTEVAAGVVVGGIEVAAGAVVGGTVVGVSVARFEITVTSTGVGVAGERGSTTPNPAHMTRSTNRLPQPPKSSQRRPLRTGGTEGTPATTRMGACARNAARLAASSGNEQRAQNFWPSVICAPQRGQVYCGWLTVDVSSPSLQTT